MLSVRFVPASVGKDLREAFDDIDVDGDGVIREVRPQARTRTRARALTAEWATASA